jgi:hypothetical protein
VWARENPVIGTRPLRRGEFDQGALFSFPLTWLPPWPCSNGSNSASALEFFSAAKEPFLSVPISPKLPDELKLPTAAKLPSLYATEKVPEFVAIHIFPDQVKGLRGSLDVGRTLRGMLDFV